VAKGIKFTKPGHNIYKIAESSVDVVLYWQVKDKAGKLVDGKERGRYTYTFESTAAYGGTIFWKYSDAFLNASSNRVYK